MEGIQNPPMIHIIQGSDNRLGILAAEKNGMIKYWDDYKDRTFLTYQIPLSPKEYITTLQEIPGEQVVIGSSQENIYLAQLKRDEISAFSFYSQRSLMRSLSEFFFATRTLPSLSDIGNYGLPCMGKILRIAFVEGYIYITYTKHIAVWRINENEVKVKEKPYVFF
ncbi:hypothetical protein G6F56_013529 [Rhizopus delemar]|nr:hypothetical protein G6F56_013529 [Rhizopus delemar]